MNTVQEIRIELYRDSKGRSPILEWLSSIKSHEFLDRIDARLNLIRLGNLGDHKFLEGGICELRLYFGPGYRIYFAREGRTIIILLNGGGKGSQKRDIQKARAYYKDYLERRK